MNATMQRMESQLVYSVHEGMRIAGYLVIDSMVRGRACGGLRMAPHVEESEIRSLARSMTLKYGLLGLARGGAKAGLVGDPEAPQQERRERLAEFGRAIAPLLRDGTYTPAPDMGTEYSDIRHVVEAAGVKIPWQRIRRGAGTGYYTALTVMAGARAAAAQMGLPLSRCRVAIEGYGAVGEALATRLAQEKVRVVAISTRRGAIFNPSGLDVKALNKLAADAGSRVVEQYSHAERMDLGALLELPVELLCPCAGYHTLRVENASRMTARAICPGANNPVTPEAERVLLERGVLSLPDFVTNCGGVLGGTLAHASVTSKGIETFIERNVGPFIAWLIEESKRRHTLPREIAEEIAMRRFNRVSRPSRKDSALNEIIKTGMGLYERGWVPRLVAGALSLIYLERGWRRQVSAYTS
jgi:glutamate dehydrogenase (NAD(P)+)